MISSGQIHLLENNNCFFSGGTIRGTVEIQSPEDVLVKDIYIILKGTINVRWIDLDQKSKHGEIVYFMQNFESKEVCVQLQIALQHDSILRKGRQDYQFIMKIPEDIPSSLASTTGTIKYKLILMLNGTDNCHKLQQQTVQIQRRLNIAEFPQLMLPFTTHYAQYFCWWPCKSKPITTRVTLPSRAFTSGEYVNYCLHIENHTQFYDVKRVSVLVIQIRQFKSSKPKERLKTELCTLNYRTHQNPCNRNSKNCIEDTFQLSTSLEASSPVNSAIMLGYRFQVLVIMKGFHKDGSIVVPLTIGSHRQYVDAGVGDFISKRETIITISDPLLSFQSPPEHLEQPSEARITLRAPIV